MPLSSSELRDVAFQLKELARSREREDEKKFFLHMFLMQEIRARRMLDTVACEIKELSHEIKGMSKDLKEIVGHLDERRALGEIESEQT